jgi:Uma2 family endonuclease
MPGDAAHAVDPRFPNLRPEVVQGYLNAPETVVAEILDGELSLMPRPRPRHAMATIRLSGKLDAKNRGGSDDDGPGAWVILIEPELHLGPGPDIVVPDLAGWRRERFPDGALDDDAAGHLVVAPDWLCEVLSPRTEASDRGKKMRIYRREGVGHLWYVAPALKTVEVNRLEGKRYVILETYEGDERMRAEPFEDVEIPLAVLWSL